MTIAPDETVLTGRWSACEDRVVADETCQRIEDLFRSHLIELAKGVTGWDTIYRDPDDGRLWELTYPQSELHGGGPPQLCHMALEEATSKYGEWE